MCGIAGFTKKDENTLGKMLTDITHRGPDGEGRYVDDRVSLGMRRLAIIDPEGGKQPIWNADKTLCIFFNGEIYNYQELWKDLKNKGYKFSTDHSDTETILLGYEEWGVDVLQRLRGMFAFVIYDTKSGEMFIARDRLGIKPLYYTHIDGDFYFGSELKQLTGLKGYRAKLDLHAASAYLYHRVHDATEHTFFEGITRMHPAHYMIVTANGKIKEYTKYWEPKINSAFGSTKSDQEYAQELRELYIDTLRLHLISDVPVGISLSGGLDSTGVAAITRKLIAEKSANLHTQKMHTFSVVYPGASMNEQNYIDIAADFVQSEKHIIKPTVEGFWDEIEDWLYTQEEPTISSGPYANYNVMREASKYVKVMLSGQGGDELFAGYIPYFTSYMKAALSSGRVDALARELIKGADLYLPFFRQVLTSKVGGSKMLPMNTLLQNDKLKGYEYEYTRSSNLNERLWDDVTKFSVPNLLRYEDKNSMRFSVEGRVPFLDHKLVEYILSLPIDQKIKHGWNRYVYRNALKGFLPEQIEKRRKKVGFTTPESDWIKQKGEHILGIFESDLFATQGLYDSRAVTTHFKAWLEGKVSADAMTFWRILNLHLWSLQYNVSISF